MAQTRSAASGRNASSGRTAASGRTSVGDWTVRYEANALPTASTPIWTAIGTASTEEIESGILHLACDINNQRYYYINDATMSNSIGTIIETRMKVVASEGVGLNVGVWFYIDDDIRNVDIGIQEDKVFALGRIVSETDEYSMDTTDDYHIYRFKLKGNTFTAYVDGIERLSFTVSGSGGNQEIYFGDGQSNGAATDNYYDYVYYSTSNNPRQDP